MAVRASVTVAMMSPWGLDRSSSVVPSLVWMPGQSAVDAGQVAGPSAVGGGPGGADAVVAVVVRRGGGTIDLSVDPVLIRVEGEAVGDTALGFGVDHVVGVVADADIAGHRGMRTDPGGVACGQAGGAAERVVGVAAGGVAGEPVRRVVAVAGGGWRGAGGAVTIDRVIPRIGIGPTQCRSTGRTS